jgi:hypothetical protein
MSPRYFTPQRRHTSRNKHILMKKLRRSGSATKNGVRAKGRFEESLRE